MEEGQDKPRLIAFEVTRRCRFHCRHCHTAAGRANEQQELNTDQCKQILKSVAGFNKCVLVMTGGELLERDDAYELIECGRGLGLRMVSATCGYTVNDKTAAKLKKAGILALFISIDGASAQTHDAFRDAPGTFDAAINATKAATRAAIPFQVNMTITKANVKELSAVAKLAERLGAYCFNPFILVPTGRGKDTADQILIPRHYEKLLRDLLELKLASPIDVRLTCGPQFTRVIRDAKIKGPKARASGCMGGRSLGFISHKGDVQTCGFLNISAGNLVDNGYDFARIWVESPLLNDIRDCGAYKGKCGRCEYLVTCRGCRARAWSVQDNYLAGDPVCAHEPRR